MSPIQYQSATRCCDAPKQLTPLQQRGRVLSFSFVLITPYKFVFLKKIRVFWWEGFYPETHNCDNWRDCDPFCFCCCLWCPYKGTIKTAVCVFKQRLQWSSRHTSALAAFDQPQQTQIPVHGSFDKAKPEKNKSMHNKDDNYFSALALVKFYVVMAYLFEIYFSVYFSW